MCPNKIWNRQAHALYCLDCKYKRETEYQRIYMRERYIKVRDLDGRKEDTRGKAKGSS